MRFERLRAQDGQPLLPPPNLRHLAAGGGLDPAKVMEARQQWDAARGQMQAGPSYPVEERLFWTTFLLARHYAEHDARREAMQIIEATLPLLHDPRHRQITLGLGARNAAVLHDFATADRYLAQLDPRSDDLQVDTNYRFTTAYVALTRNDHRTALHVLGMEIDDVPISDAYDTVCGVLRAHAHEAAGQHELACTQLMKLAASPDRLARVQDIARSNKSLQLVPHSLPVVAERVRQLFQNVVVTRSGINLKGIFILPILGIAAAAGGEALASAVGPPLGEWLPGLLIGAFVVFSTVFALRLVLRGPMQRKRLAQSGVPGTAQLLVVEQTGTRVNDQPMVRLRMLVELPNRAPYTVLHNEVVPLIRLSQLVPGSTVGVRVDANDPALMAVMWS
jgi:hypothetical protein